MRDTTTAVNFDGSIGHSQAAGTETEASHRSANRLADFKASLVKILQCKRYVYKEKCGKLLDSERAAGNESPGNLNTFDLIINRSTLPVGNMVRSEPLTPGYENGSWRAVPTMRVEELETPALLIDLDAMDSNLSRVSECYRLGPVKARPHFKNHCVAALAKRQMACGAIGITVARVRHAEVLVERGIPSILIANEIVDDSSLRRLIKLSRRAEIILSVDDAQNIARIAHLAGDAKSNVNVVIDLEVGLGRCGAPSNGALTLARLARDAGLRVRGLMGYEGHLQKMPDTDETRQLRSDVTAFSTAPVFCLRRWYPRRYRHARRDRHIQGLSRISRPHRDSSRQLPFDGHFLQTVCAGFPTRTYCSDPRNQPATPDHLVLDAGLKALSSERGMPTVKASPVCASGPARRACHCPVEDSRVRVRTNDLIELWVHYSDATVHLHRVCTESAAGR